MFDGREVDLDETAACKQMRRYLRLMHMIACIVAAFAIAAAACASGVAAGSAQKLNADVARAAIAQAERAVRRSEAQRMLWTTAEEALRRARRAFEDGDLAAAVAQARTAREHADLAIAQKRYPPFRI
jgi:hypothetical protein